MYDRLRQIIDDGGFFLGADYAIVQGIGYPSALALRFEFVTAIFRAVPEDDRISITFDHFLLQEGELQIPAPMSSIWQKCYGCKLSGAYVCVGINREFDLASAFEGPVVLIFFNPDPAFEATIQISVSQAIMMVHEVVKIPQTIDAPECGPTVKNSVHSLADNDVPF